MSYRFCVNCGIDLPASFKRCTGRLCFDVAICDDCVIECQECRAYLCPCCKFTCRYGCTVLDHCETCFTQHREESRRIPRVVFEQRWQAMSESSESDSMSDDEVALPSPTHPVTRPTLSPELHNNDTCYVEEDYVEVY